MRLRDNGKPEKGLAFMQQKDGKKVRCDHCQEEGHYKLNCPSKARGETGVCWSWARKGTCNRDKCIYF